MGSTTHRVLGGVLCLVALSACSVQDNARTDLGNASTPLGVSLSALDPGMRSESSREGDARSLKAANLARSHWRATTVSVPSDSIHAYRTYARQRLWSDETARQRGEFPTPATALELADARGDEVIHEALLSGPGAIADALLMVPRFFFVSPDEPVRHYPSAGWRAPVFTQRYTASELAARQHNTHASDPGAPASSTPSRTLEPAQQVVPPSDRP